MSERRTDFELLRDFARHGDQSAFASVVRRHVDLVYGTAMRKVEDQGAAEEIAQNVFAALARKAWQFASDDSLPAWLHRTALLEARGWLRGELRRRRREQSAAELGTTMKTPDEQTALRALVPLLDEALLSLREQDRAALLLRYYESQSLREVGASLGVAEDTAQKRVASAVEKLARFFQRRGFKTVTGAVAAASLQQTTASAPAAVAAAVTQAATQLTPPTLLGFAALLSRFASLTKTQTAALCVVIAAAPVAWQWNEVRAAGKEAIAMQSGFETSRAQEERLSNEIDRLRAESARLSGALIEATQAQMRDEAALRKFETLGARIRSLLTDSNYRWPEDLPYVRIAKWVLKELDLQAMFRSSGTVSEPATEILGMTPEERLVTERALGNYWNGVKSLMAARAYETNMPVAQAGRLAKTVIIPPLGQELKTLAENTRAQLTDRLGAERENMLFGGWEEGAIQIFWPGNLWKISEEPQNFTVWVDPTASNTNGPLYGAGWHSGFGGMSPEGGGSLNLFPREIATQFFLPWLRQYGITNSITP